MGPLYVRIIVIVTVVVGRRDVVVVVVETLKVYTEERTRGVAKKSNPVRVHNIIIILIHAHTFII